MNDDATQSNSLNMCEPFALNHLLIEIGDLINAISREQTLISLALEQVDLNSNDKAKALETAVLLLNHYQDATQPILGNIIETINQARNTLSGEITATAKTCSESA